MRRKIDDAVCSRDENGVLAFFEHVLFPILSTKVIHVDGKDYDNYKDLFDDYNAGRISEAGLKQTLKVCLISYFMLYCVALHWENNYCCIFGFLDFML